MAGARPPVSTAVYDALRADVLGSRLVPGDAIPSERALSERFGVNRHAVREAVKRLQQAGLVHVSQGGATRVLDWSRTGGLELLTDLPAAGDLEAARAGYELRACLAAEIAARAAERAGEADRTLLGDRADVLARARERAAADADPDPDGTAGPRAAAVLDAYRALWDVLVDAAQNIAYRLAYNSLLAGEAAMPQLALGLLRAELEDAEAAEALVAAVLASDGGRARAAATTLTAHPVLALSAPEVPVA